MFLGKSKTLWNRLNVKKYIHLGLCIIHTIGWFTISICNINPIIIKYFNMVTKHTFPHIRLQCQTRRNTGIKAQGDKQISRETDYLNLSLPLSHVPFQRKQTLIWLCFPRVLKLNWWKGKPSRKRACIRK